MERSKLLECLESMGPARQAFLIDQEHFLEGEMKRLEKAAKIKADRELAQALRTGGVAVVDLEWAMNYLNRQAWILGIVGLVMGCGLGAILVNARQIEAFFR